VPKVPDKVYEPHEGNSLPYWTAGQVGALSVLFSTLGTGFEDERTNKAIPAIAFMGLYLTHGCGFATGYHDVQTQDWFEKRSDYYKSQSSFVPKPTSEEEILKQKKEFYLKQKEYDRTSTILSFLANLGNGISARESASRALGIGLALFNLTYYYWDPNAVRAYEPPAVTTFVAPMHGDLVVGLRIGF